MKIFAVTVSGASTFFRFTQYKPALEEAGFTFGEDADITLIQKQLLPLSQQKKIRKQAKRLFFDFDDAIWTRPVKPYSWITQLRIKSRLHYWLRKADVVMCSSSFLASYAAKFCTAHVIPLALDTDLWKPLEKKNTPVRIGWAGAPHNLHHLERLDALLGQIPDIELHVFSGKRPHMNMPYTYYPYEEITQIPFIQNLDIGLLPLSNEEFSLGKSPIKAIQYIACGVPVIGNVYGATEAILKNDFSIAVESEKEWIEALKKLASDPLLRQSMAVKARAFALQHHSFKSALNQLLKLLKG